jgi:SAM-dependent methyltransferase
MIATFVIVHPTRAFLGLKMTTTTTTMTMTTTVKMTTIRPLSLYSSSSSFQIFALPDDDRSSSSMDDLESIMEIDFNDSADDTDTDESDDDDDDAISAFGTRHYWDELYQGNGDFPSEEYQWYYGWEKYGPYVKQYIPINSNNNNKDSTTTRTILIPGIGNDPILLDMLQNKYTTGSGITLIGTDYSPHAIERQRDLLSYVFNTNDRNHPHPNEQNNKDDNSNNYCYGNIQLYQMDVKNMPQNWTGTIDAIIEKGLLDAIYLSGKGKVELAVQELERTLKPDGIFISISGVIPSLVRQSIFTNWTWIRDGSDDLQAGCFIFCKKTTPTPPK